FSFGKGNLNRDRDLAELNGGNGVRAGKISITDRSGAQATIDLTDTTTVNEVLDRLNNADGISINATVNGDGLVITDTSGGAGSLTIANAANTFTATDLGIVGTSAGGVINGTAINTLGSSTGLGSLNDGNGVLVRNNN